jgi:hypothetical protein
MRWTGLIVAIACTHSQPPPPPLSVPPEKAAGPAAPEDAGMDAGTSAQDAGAARGQRSLDVQGAACELDRPAAGRLAQR